MKKLTSERVMYFVGGLPTAFAVALIAFAAATLSAQATPQMAKDTGQPCMMCHTTPPALNAYGQKYKNGQKK